MPWTRPLRDEHPDETAARADTEHPALLLHPWTASLGTDDEHALVGAACT